MPVDGDRAVLEARRNSLVAHLAPSDKAALVGRVARLFLRFPASRTPDAEAVVAAYATDLSKFPLWAIDAAMIAAIEGQGHAAAFAPSSVELQKLCQRELEPVHGELGTLTKILDAAVYHDPGDEERKRVAEKFDELIRSLRLREPMQSARGKHIPTRAEAEEWLKAAAGNLPPVKLSSAALKALSLDGSEREGATNAMGEVG